MQTITYILTHAHTFIHTYILIHMYVYIQAGLIREKDNELKKIVYEIEVKTSEHKDQV